MRNLITDYLGVHAQAMPLREQRMKLIASNLGNADTPGYKAQDLDFDAALLQQALDAYGSRERRFGLTSAQIAALATETSSP